MRIPAAFSGARTYLARPDFPFLGRERRAFWAPILTELFWDLVLLAGCAVFSFGVWLAWHPGGVMVSGILLVAAALIIGPRKVPVSVKDNQ